MSHVIYRACRNSYRVPSRKDACDPELPLISRISNVRLQDTGHLTPTLRHKLGCRILRRVRHAPQPTGDEPPIIPLVRNLPHHLLDHFTNVSHHSPSSSSSLDSRLANTVSGQLLRSSPNSFNTTTASVAPAPCTSHSKNLAPSSCMVICKMTLILLTCASSGYTQPEVRRQPCPW